MFEFTCSLNIQFYSLRNTQNEDMKIEKDLIKACEFVLKVATAHRPIRSETFLP